MWTKENTLFLINMYEQSPNLYNCNNPSYKNKTKRRLSLTNISEEINSKFKMETNTDIIAKKINGLRTTFMQELNKIKKSKASGAGTEDIYQPGWWCFEHLLFLSESSVTNPGQSNLIIEQENSKLEEQDLTQDVNYEESQVLCDSIFDNDTAEQREWSPSLVAQTSKKLPFTRIQREEPPKKKAKNAAENEFFTNVNKALETITTKETEPDHIYRFAQHIESELRLIGDKNKVRKLKAAISKVIFDEQED